MDKNQIIIFDTTLRDGQQCPWAWMSFEDNIKFAYMASRLWIDVLEAWFPSASKEDFKIVNTIAKELAPLDNSMTICWLCQLRENQVDITIESLLPAVKYKKARFHIYLPVDPNLLIASLGDKANDKKQLIKNTFDFISKAVNAWLEVEFSPEWYSCLWDNYDFTTELIRAAVSAWATTINCPDTIWWAHILQWEDYYLENIKKHTEMIKNEFPNKDIIWSCHNHNDFWCAVENSIKAVFDWPVRQIEVAVNWIWERSWNASLEQCAMIIKHYAKYRNPNNPLFTNINTDMLKEVSDFVSDKMLPRQPNFPIVWDNAAKHSSWWHTNAILNNPLSYQPFDPSEVWTKITFSFWPLSWWNHAKDIIKNFGYICDDDEKAEIAQFIKDYFSTRRKGITDNELLKWYFEYRNPINITSFDYSKSSDTSSVNLTWKFFDLNWSFSKNNPWKDSALAALKFLIEDKFWAFKIQNYESKADSEWIDAKSISTILIKTKANSWIYKWIWIDEDIEISAMKALINAVNNAYVEMNFKT